MSGAGVVLGLGCDIVSVARIARMGQRYPQAFLERVFGAQERLDAGPAPDWARCARHVAAKEAFFKALGTGLVGDMRWRDVEVVYQLRRVGINAHGAASRQLRECGARQSLVSLAGNATHAMATVLLLSE